MATGTTPRHHTQRQPTSQPTRVPSLTFQRPRSTGAGQWGCCRHPQVWKDRSTYGASSTRFAVTAGLPGTKRSREPASGLPLLFTLVIPTPTTKTRRGGRSCEEVGVMAQTVGSGGEHSRQWRSRRGCGRDEVTARPKFPQACGSGGRWRGAAHPPAERGGATEASEHA